MINFLDAGRRVRRRDLASVGFIVAGLAAGGAEAAAYSPAAVKVQIDASAALRHPISPLIYGVGGGAADGNTAADLQILNVPLNRLGGNSTTTYNWQQNVWNLDDDWYFESYPLASATPGDEVDSFIAGNKAVGAQSMVTIPMIGWVAKLGANRAILPAFSVAKYGPQAATDPYLPDAGNGVKTDGSFVTGNDPNDAYSPDSVSAEQALVQHLVSGWGAANAGGAGYYLLDNESSIWFGTHRDIHPVGAHATEIRDDAISFAAMIHGVDPNAKVVGPEEWGWSGYLYSGYDQQWGSIHGWGGTLPDHDGVQGGVDYLSWLLSQWKQAGHPVDVFSVHFYPQGAELNDDNSTATQLLRNRSTRQLWDPNYVSESWIGTQVQLIPRLKSLVATNYYADTPVAVTEYQWGADNYINGATTQADVLGIFGREGLDLATRWTIPAASTPSFKAMQMYRNYDWNRNGFGDVGVAATVPNPDDLSSFAALRSSDGALTVMIINKSLPRPGPATPTPVSLALTGFNAQGKAMRYQLTASNAITRLSDQPVSGSSVSLAVPAQSVTLLVLPASPGSVHEPPIAGFNATPTTPTSAQPVSAVAKFVASSSVATSYPIQSYAWDFGDGTTGSGAKTSHAFTSYGFFQTVLTVSDTQGYVGKATETITVKPTPATATTCTIAYQDTDDWGTGFTGNLHITNTGAAAISNWLLDWSFPGSQSISDLWNGILASNGREQLVTPAAWDTSIAPGASIDVGFVASYSGTNAKPSSILLNGMSCVLQ